MYDVDAILEAQRLRDLDESNNNFAKDVLFHTGMISVEESIFLDRMEPGSWIIRERIRRRTLSGNPPSCWV
jgi:hypothetical protein